MPDHPRSTNSQMTLPNAMLTLKLMYSAFIVGLMAFAIIVLVLQLNSAPPSPSAPPPPDADADGMDLMFGVLVGAWAIFVLPASLFFLPAMRKSAGIAAADAHSDDEPDAAKLAAIGPYTTALLLRAALVEGWGLFSTVAALLTGNMLFLIAPVLAVAILGAFFPTRAKFERYYTESLDIAAKRVHQ